ncbi:uncharacterized protein LOC128199880 [Bicyclus anynana]|uniref:Uncharacterized protein LOC128199880 n=1 Tax=Bicyclus anynana TaxID=110368 RepID=A0ABM3M6Q7_BICAN|nr:uncharacterized protein LOC128199880 [Bicyclus anynana]
MLASGTFVVLADFRRHETSAGRCARVALTSDLINNTLLLLTYCNHRQASASERRVLVAAGGCGGDGGAGARRGRATALLLWALPGRAAAAAAARGRPPGAARAGACRAAPRAGRRAARAARRGRRARAVHAARRRVPPLDHQIFGLVLHPSRRCVWAATAGGARCVSLPALRRCCACRWPARPRPRPRRTTWRPPSMTATSSRKTSRRRETSPPTRLLSVSTI